VVESFGHCIGTAVDGNHYVDLWRLPIVCTVRDGEGGEGDDQ